MKVKVILFSLFSIISFASIAQEDVENSYILICGTNQSSFLLEDYKSCNTVSVRDSEHKVGSFLFVGLKKSKRIEIEIIGDHPTEEALNIISKLKAPMRIRIEKVVDETGTPLEGFRQLTLTE